MASTTVIVGAKSGLHARPASTFIRAAAQSGAAVHIYNAAGTRANAASLLAVLSLGVKHGDELTLTVTGNDDARILGELATLLTSDLDAA